MTTAAAVAAAAAAAVAAAVAVAVAAAAAVAYVNSFTPPIFVGDERTHTQTHKYLVSIIILTQTVTTIILTQKFYPKPFLALFFCYKSLPTFGFLYPCAQQSFCGLDVSYSYSLFPS